MPSVATRRSTRVFVRKNVSKVGSDGDPTAKVLRSGKRLSLSKSIANHNVGEGDGSSYDWLEIFGSTVESESDDMWRKKSGCLLRKGIKEDIPGEDKNVSQILSEKGSDVLLGSGSLYGIFYSRKRRRSHLDSDNSFKAVWNSLFDCLRSSSSEPGVTSLGNVSKKRRLSFLDERLPSRPKFLDKEFEITATARGLAEKFLIPRRYLWLGLAKPVALVLLLKSSRISSLDRFSSLLVSILRGIMSGGTTFYECSSFLSHRPIPSVLSLNDIHFLPLKSWKPEYHRGLSTHDSGFCTLLRPQIMVPRVSVNFSSLPFLFKSWHFSIFYRLIYNPNCTTICDIEVSVEEQRLLEYLSRAKPAASERTISSSGISSSFDSDSVIVAPVSLASEESSSTAIRTLSRVNASKLRKRSRKRSLLRNGRVPRRTQFRIKVHPIQDSLESEILIDSGTEGLASVIQKRRRSSPKSYAKKMKESKNIDRLSCSANVLVVESDRCWRESGAKVTLEVSNSKEWFLVVKSNNATRFTHKALDTKPSASNRITHAPIWAGENGWKLEFPNKDDWNVFKELHKECLERNFQEIPSRTVPIPGVFQVSGFEESYLSHFKRPDLYIRSGIDEVERALTSEKALYDMDSGDEEWLEKLNANQSLIISMDDFERIITVLEKAAYSHPDDASDHAKAAALCSTFGTWSRIGDVHDYWMKKRRQKHLPLLAVFQGQPPKKKHHHHQQQSTQKPHLRKKRSFKRQSSQSSRGSVDVFYEAAAKQEAIERFQSADSAVSQYVEAAIRLRSTAQELMVNADLAAYKAVMALKLAAAIKGGFDNPDLPFPG